MYKNELGIREVTREEAENLGIDLSMVKACKTFRRLAKLDRLTLDETVHRSGLNKHLFDYIEQIEVFSMLQQISFTSYGRDTFLSISLLIDSLTVQKDVISKQVADFALVTFTQSLLLTEEQKQELLELLEMKYRVTSIKGIDTILDRVRLALTQRIEKDPFGDLFGGEEH